MANIGNLKRNEQGVFIGRLVAPDFSVTVYLATVERTKERSPVCEVMGLNPSRDWARLGALFEQTARETGVIFYQGSITPPKTDKRYYITLFRQNDGSFNVVLNEPSNNRRAPMSSPEMAGSGEPGVPADDGLGESTAPNTGLPPIPAGDPAPMGDPVDSGNRRGKANKPAEEPTPAV
ncbi:DUF736 family protein [Sphingomonas sp. H39-1-10]|uniref:DUF736 family protein n=1 Tax=Sphingomonas pollutisoli TaxID=3030829 RepID=UPI0023B93172|nr:DUF736 family protein [Sphingomonas pollutisoli]MDF0490440.1 DUF736 family protein [Sphingomonas pollutisoli]